MEFSVNQLVNAEEEIEEELALVAETGVDQVNWLETQRQALLAIAEAKTSEGKSILPTGSIISAQYVS